MILKNATIVTEEIEIRENVDLFIEDDKILEIKDSNSDATSTEVIDCSNYIVMPGFYNAHGHSPMSLMRGYGENMNLQDWLFNKIFPFEDKLTSEAVYYGTLLSMAESLKYGIVSTSDMYYFLDDMVEAVLKSECKANISRAIANPAGDPFESLASVGESKDAFEKYHGESNGKIKIDTSLHAEYTSNEDTAIKLAELNKELGLIMHVHVSETKSETDECKERHEGRTPTKYLADCGIFDGPSLAAHCVWITESDMDILKEKNVVVATNPVSNLKLASGICPVGTLVDKGVTVAIGTDSVASNNNLNMFEEMKTMSLLAKVTAMDPRVITPKEALTMATRNGAIAQGRHDCGLIKEGYKADLVLLKKNSPNMSPAHDPISNIVYSASDSDIYLTMVDGKVLYKDGEYLTIDIEDTIKGVEKSVKDILGRL